VSAGETFTLALMDRKPHVLRIGSNTQGVFSDVLNRNLPDGWRFRLPNEIYLTSHGEAFDAIGIPRIFGLTLSRWSAGPPAWKDITSGMRCWRDAGRWCGAELRPVLSCEGAVAILSDNRKHSPAIRASLICYSRSS